MCFEMSRSFNRHLLINRQAAGEASVFFIPRLLSDPQLDPPPPRRSPPAATHGRQIAHYSTVQYCTAYPVNLSRLERYDLL